MDNAKIASTDNVHFAFLAGQMK